jgi:hypothetical protein
MAPRSPGGCKPWAFATGRSRHAHRGKNGHVERLIGSIRHECLDHVVEAGSGIPFDDNIALRAGLLPSALAALELSTDIPQPLRQQCRRAVAGYVDHPVCANRGPGFAFFALDSKSFL